MINTEVASPPLNFWQKLLGMISKIGVLPEDNEELRLQKFICVVTAVLITIAAIIWGLFYLLFDEIYAGLIPLAYAFLTINSIFIFRSYNIFRIFHLSQTFLILSLPFFLMMVLGGFINGSVVIIWGIFAPVSALLSTSFRKAVYWFIAFIALVVLSGIIQPYLRVENNLPAGIIHFLFVINIATVSLITFLILNYFVRQKDKVIGLMHINRELELSYLQQEVMLRQSEKLATLGRLSAGMAHELNNPATVALRGSKKLQDNFLKLNQTLLEFGQINLSEIQKNVYEKFKDQIHIRAKNPVELDPITRSDRENEIESWLEKQNITDALDVASMLANLNFNVEDLSKVAKNFSHEQLPVMFSSLHRIYDTDNLLSEINQGAGRITEIVKALKSYSYMDKSSKQSIDIHEGLNDTLVMLRSQLKTGITVIREYDESLPRIQAFGSELNQVWTNIIDNAISAMNGQGKIIIKTFRQDPWLVVQIIDSGPGIPENIQAKVFDPFFTTKPPGEGTGLGLNISYNIVVKKHNGKIKVYSKKGETCFEVMLSLNNDLIKDENEAKRYEKTNNPDS